MSYFKVRVRRVVTYWADMEIEAENADAAGRQALDLADDRGATWVEPDPERAVLESVTAA